MGFKKTNVEIGKLGITIPKAYAQIENLSVGLDGSCFASFKIQTARDAMDKPALDTKHVYLIIEKDLPVHKQVYEYAKTEVFADWEDDIPAEE